MPSRAHEELIDHFIENNPDAQRRSFDMAIREAVIADEIAWEPETSAAAHREDVNECWEFFDLSKRIRPDAFLIMHGQRHVVLFEAVCSHRFSKRRMAALGDLFWFLDNYTWTFEVEVQWLDGMRGYLSDTEVMMNYLRNEKSDGLSLEDRAKRFQFFATN